jgi:hypothetical protein
MESEDIYKYVGFTIIVICLIYIGIKTLKFQYATVEGMTTDKDKIPEAIKSITTIYEDSLLIDKYTKAYEDTIINLDANMDINILFTILQSAEKLASSPLSEENQKLIIGLNNLKSFKDTLNHAIKVLDKK